MSAGHAPVGAETGAASGSASGRPRIGIAGIHGHGASHVRAALELVRAGRAELAAVADPRPVEGDLATLAGGATTGGAGASHPIAVYADAAAMIAAEGLDIVVLSTPMHTHLPLALAALDAGSHVLLEKPPTPTLADFRRLVDASAEAGRAVQVGFQSLGSAGIAAVHDLVATGAVGEVRHYGALGTWLRTEAYWTRAAWAGRRTLDGVPVVDGAVTNPLAHATATALAIAGATSEADVAAVRLDLHRANAIEADDTSSLVVDLVGRPPLAAALSLTAPRRSEPSVIVEGTAGRIVYWYTLDLVQVFEPGSTVPVTSTHARTGLLENLVDHVSAGAPLLVPVAATGGFMRILEAVRMAPAPEPIDPSFLERRTGADGAHLVVDGIEAWSERVVLEGRTFAELGAPWA
ncbi:gfo/Idh/MocA family oxidoreductase [Agromyces sp. CFH 90414]|uniref:Gfo/Idh/MocA family oxidoreductase n=1 Tax=Agromyces agglutinans TaxID=2662258 RepID=A0A6I2FBE9_9MICO|nr:Gfo/Idh/MocA family oxidoreductase [Agromyces agglutinans]MRG61681.1 gfo/Idh/MocA family oxidoreductase [Agromyces agglutinans]